MPEPAKELTIADHIIKSLTDHPTRWKEGDTVRTLVHPNGTRLYYYDEWATLQSDPGVRLTEDERKSIATAIYGCLREIHNHKSIQAHKRALERWTKTRKGPKPQARKT